MTRVITGVGGTLGWSRFQRNLYCTQGAQTPFTMYYIEVTYRLSLRLHNKSYYGSVHVQIFGLRCKGAELNLMIILLRMILLGP